MKQCLALAGLVCLLASGCAHMGKFTANSDGGVAASQPAAKTRAADISLASFEGQGIAGAGCGCSVDGCPVGGCTNGCYGADGCNCGPNGPCRRLVDGIASGFCGNGANGYGNGNCLCPHAGGYPEYPNFNQGPPVGQVAYPYYTVRGPRDFLRDNPPSIGPY